MASTVVIVRPAAEAGAAQRERAGALAARLGLPLVPEDQLSRPLSDADERPAGSAAADFLLLFDQERLSLRMCGSNAPGAIAVDFEAAALDYRRRGNLRGESLVRAAGLKGSYAPLVLDATAGLGQDAFILAAAGCEVQLCERSPLLAALLEDGLRRALLSPDEKVAQAAGRMSLRIGDSRSWMASGEMDQPDLVYLDPMFPERRKSARVKKEMFVLQQLLHGALPTDQGCAADDKGLVAHALQAARKRVVVKRPRLAPCLDERRPDFQLNGKSSRFDVYLIHPEA